VVGGYFTSPPGGGGIFQHIEPCLCSDFAIGYTVIIVKDGHSHFWYGHVKNGAVVMEVGCCKRERL
jgi:hypothetical protein